MITFKADITPKEWQAVTKWSKAYRQKMNAAMRRALAVLHGRVTLNLSGPSHVLFPGNGNPFPGVISGRMRGSISAKVYNRIKTIRGVVGPNVHYAIKHVLGLGVPKRDFLTPAVKRERSKVNRILRRAIRDALS